LNHFTLLHELEQLLNQLTELSDLDEDVAKGTPTAASASVD